MDCGRYEGGGVTRGPQGRLPGRDNRGGGAAPLRGAGSNSGPFALAVFGKAGQVSLRGVVE